MKRIVVLLVLAATWTSAALLAQAPQADAAPAACPSQATLDELIKAIEERLSGGYAPSPGVVYPTLTLLAGVGHWLLGSIDWHLLLSLLTGSN